MNDKLKNSTMGEPSPPGGDTGPGWKANLFLFLRCNFFSKQNEIAFIRDQLEPPSEWWLPIESQSKS